MEVKQKAALIYNAIEDKKGSRISVLDISGISVMADYFVIADAENNNQLQAIADNVEEQMMKNGNHCRIEGKSESGWERLETVEQAGLKEGDTVSVKLIDINPKTGKFKISGKELLPKPEGYEEHPPRPERGDFRPRREYRD